MTMEMCVQSDDCSHDVEAAGECPAMFRQQAFIYKVYSIIAVQFLLTIFGIITLVFSFHPLVYFIMSSNTGVSFYLVISITAIIISLFLSYCCQLENFLLLWVLTTCLTFLVGLTCAVASGKVILESAILTAALVFNLTLYTFWAASRGHDFYFLGPFLFSAIVVIMVLASIQIVFQLDKIFVTVYGFLGSITLCGLIVCVTDSLIIKSHSYDKYIWAAVSLYVDIINLFLLLLTVFKTSDYEDHY